MIAFRAHFAGVLWQLHHVADELVRLAYKRCYQEGIVTMGRYDNARGRHLHPAASAVGVQIGGWHDFRHTLSMGMRRAGVHPVVVRDTLHHSKVDLAMNVYDKASAEDIRDGLRVVTKKLLSRVLLPKDLLPSTPKPAQGSESAA